QARGTEGSRRDWPGRAGPRRGRSGRGRVHGPDRRAWRPGGGLRRLVLAQAARLDLEKGSAARSRLAAIITGASLSVPPGHERYAAERRRFSNVIAALTSAAL